MPVTAPLQLWTSVAVTMVLTLSEVATGPLDPQATTRGLSRQELMAKLFDPEHGVKMGIPADFCDDGKVDIDVDWGEDSTIEFQCVDEEWSKLKRNNMLYTREENVTKPSEHICFPDAIDYSPDDLPLSGSHRPLWPVFGEYMYLPPQRWVHSLEHGAIVFLYHPCALEDQEAEVEDIKEFLRGCLWKHTISPYRNIPKHMPYAFLSFGRAILFSMFNNRVRRELESFVGHNALTASESKVLDDGQYDAGLVLAASDYDVVYGHAYGYDVKDNVLPTCFARPSG